MPSDTINYKTLVANWEPLPRPTDWRGSLNSKSWTVNDRLVCQWSCKACGHGVSIVDNYCGGCGLRFHFDSWWLDGIAGIVPVMLDYIKFLEHRALE